MTIRGKFGFFYKGKYYICYNRFDSYPSGLGVELILELIHADLEEWIKLLENIQEVSKDIKPTPEDIKKLEKYTDLSYGGSATAWENLLRLTQGSFYHVLHSGYMINVNEKDVSEEYIYVLDLDNKEFRAEGVYSHDIDVTSSLEIEELVKLAIEWSKGELDEDYDPEKELIEMQEISKWRLEEFKNSLCYKD